MSGFEVKREGFNETKKIVRFCITNLIDGHQKHSLPPLSAFKLGVFYACFCFSFAFISLLKKHVDTFGLQYHPYHISSPRKPDNTPNGGSTQLSP